MAQNTTIFQLEEQRLNENLAGQTCSKSKFLEEE